MTNLRQRLATTAHARWCPPTPTPGHDEPPSRFPVPCWTAADAALAVFAEWLREHAAGARLIAESAPDDEDLSTVATWGGARAALSALADEIDPRAPEGQQG